MTRYPRVPLKRFGRIVGGATPTADESNWGGETPWYTPTDVSAVHGGVLGESERTLTEGGLASCSAVLVPAGSVVMTSRAPIGNVALTDRPAATNQGCKTLVPGAATDPRFILYAAQALLPDIQVAGTGTTFQEVSGERLGAVRFPKPERPCQSEIADVLDRESDRIAVARTALLRLPTAVTEHLHEWLGHQPAYLDAPALPLKRLVARLSDGPFGSALTSAHYAEVPAVRVIRLGNIGRGVFIDEDRVGVSEDYGTGALAPWLLAPGDVVLAALGDATHPLGRAAEVPLSTLPAIHKADCYRLTPDPRRCIPAYLAWALSHGRSAEYAPLVGRGATRLRLTTETARAIPVPMPSLEAQRELMVANAELMRDVDRARLRAQGLASALDLYRDSLIHEAVTGKLEVTQVSERQMEERLHAAAEGRLDEVAV